MTAPATTDGLANGRFPGAGQFPCAGQLPGGGRLPGGGNGQVPGDGLGRGGFGGITFRGTVVKATADELMIRTSNGTEVAIPVDDSTACHAQADASGRDVDDGTEVRFQVQVQPGRIGQCGQGTTPTLGTATDVTIVGD